MYIDSFVQTIEARKLNCEGIVVLRHGKETARHRWIPETARNVRSVSKSFTAIAIGMAVDQGKLSLTDRAVDVFPDCIPAAAHSRRLSSLNLEHLLTMTRGYGAFSRPTTAAEALGQKLKYEPGERFVYDNGSTLLASAMFTRRMRKTVRDFLTEALFRPLGIPDPEWPESADGHTIGATDLMLRTSDLARFGQFLLQRGEWEGRQLVSPSWIDSAGRPHVSTGTKRPENNLGYGYGFWPSRHGAYRAEGIGGQLVIVLPYQDAVVAINSDEEKWAHILYTVWDKILPLL